MYHPSPPILILVKYRSSKLTLLLKNVFDPPSPDYEGPRARQNSGHISSMDMQPKNLDEAHAATTTHSKERSQSLIDVQSGPSYPSTTVPSALRQWFKPTGRSIHGIGASSSTQSSNKSGKNELTRASSAPGIRPPNNPYQKWFSPSSAYSQEESLTTTPATQRKPPQKTVFIACISPLFSDMSHTKSTLGRIKSFSCCVHEDNCLQILFQVYKLWQILMKSSL